MLLQWVRTALAAVVIGVVAVGWWRHDARIVADRARVERLIEQTCGTGPESLRCEIALRSSGLTGNGRVQMNGSVDVSGTVEVSR